MFSQSTDKVVTVCGPTCTGKTSLALRLCRKFDGEIISVDARQIYRGMDIGTGKVPLESARRLTPSKFPGAYELDGIPIHGYDLFDPNYCATASEFAVIARKKISEVRERGRVPFLVGGSGFYLGAVLGEIQLAEVEPDWELRSRLEKLSAEKLSARLRELNSKIAERTDPKNKRRLVRAIEVELARRGRVERLFPGEAKRPVLDSLKIGLTGPRELLYQRADEWVNQVLEAGLFEEVATLRQQGYGGAEPLQNFIYREAGEFLDGRLNQEEMAQKVKFGMHTYIRRQLIWFRRDPPAGGEIHWLDISTSPPAGGFDEQASKLVRSYLRDTCYG